MRHYLLLLIVLILSGFFVNISVNFIDKPLAGFFYHFFPDTYNSFFTLISLLFQPYALLSAGIFLLAFAVFSSLVKKFKPFKRPAFFLSTCILATYIISVATGIIVCRLEPSLLFEEGIYGSGFICYDTEFRSFPSIYAAMITSFILPLMLVLKNPYFNVPAIFLIVIVSLSRVVTTENFLSDVFFGVVIAAVIAFLLKRLFKV